MRKIIVYHEFGMTLCTVVDCATTADAIVEAEKFVKRMQFRSTRGDNVPWQNPKNAKGEIVNAEN